MARKRQSPARKLDKASSQPSLGYKLLAIFTVAALVIGGVAIIVEGFLSSGGGDDGQSYNPNVSDPVLIEYQNALTKTPNDPYALVALANYLANLGRIDEAIPYYEKATVAAPDDWTIRLDFARSLSWAGKRPDAEVQYRKVLEIRPNEGSAHLGLGELYVAWVPPRNADAINEFNLAIAADPESVVAQRAREELAKLGVGTPVASPAATPVTGSEP